jgi:hypothetical protein
MYKKYNQSNEEYYAELAAEVGNLKEPYAELYQDLYQDYSAQFALSPYYKGESLHNRAMERALQDIRQKMKISYTSIAKDLTPQEYAQKVEAIKNYTPSPGYRYHFTDPVGKLTQALKLLLLPNIRVNPLEISNFYDHVRKLPFGFYLCRYAEQYRGPSKPLYTLTKPFLNREYTLVGVKIYTMIKIIELW